MRVANQALFGVSRQAWNGGQLATIPGVSEDVFADRMPCGFTPFPYSPYSRGNGPEGAISGVVATSCFVGTGYRPKARESGIPSDVETRAGTRWTREHHLKNGNHRVGVKIYIRFTLALQLN